MSNAIHFTYPCKAYIRIWSEPIEPVNIFNKIQIPLPENIPSSRVNKIIITYYKNTHIDDTYWKIELPEYNYQCTVPVRTEVMQLFSQLNVYIMPAKLLLPQDIDLHDQFSDLEEIRYSARLTRRYFIMKFDFTKRTLYDMI